MRDPGNDVFRPIARERKYLMDYKLGYLRERNAAAHSVDSDIF